MIEKSLAVASDEEAEIKLPASKKVKVLCTLNVWRGSSRFSREPEKDFMMIHVDSSRHILRELAEIFNMPEFEVCTRLSSWNIHRWELVSYLPEHLRQVF